MDKRLETDIVSIFTAFENGRPGDALNTLLEGYKYNLDSKETDIMRFYARYWITKFNALEELDDAYEKGERLFVEWKNFISYITLKGTYYKEAIDALCRGVFSKALHNYMGIAVEENVRLKGDILVKKGICFKKLGNYEKATDCLVSANKVLPMNAKIISELADCYALIGNDNDAKILFQEAFYINSTMIDLTFLDSSLISSLIKSVEKRGYTGNELNLWLPVYAVIQGVFYADVKLTSKDLGHLKQQIYALENNPNDKKRNAPDIKPRLIYLYFRLLAHCKSVGDEKTKSETLLRLQLLDTNIYNQYK